jgi:sterol desaturase/sphingolipid hydroxylase (fatty acid hydroxylase superfamily)
VREQLTGLAIAFGVLLAASALVNRLRRPERRMAVLRRGFATDVGYWVFTPFVTKATTRLAVIAGLVPVALLIYGRVDAAQLQAGFGPAARLPLWQQAGLMLIIADFIGYWMHRLFHGRRLWRFHAIHHSSVDLDWLSSVRVHPVNDAVMRVASALPLVALGFAPLALAGIVPILTLMAVLVHANLDWDFGPLRAVIASPRFHRWHHTDEREARDKNFAGLFPVWDILFGTYHMPRDKLPTTFGTATPVPGGLIGQLAFPFRRSRANGAGAGEGP